MLTRRGIMTMLAAWAIAPAADAHTLFNQWVVYRRKHLLVGSHRNDLKTHDLANDVVMAMQHLLPEASARTARAPHPERLASLLGTGQLELAVLSPGDAEKMLAGLGNFAPYGAIPLTLVANLGSHLLLAHRDFPEHHAWLVSAVLENISIVFDTSNVSIRIEEHPGTVAFYRGVAMPEPPSL